MLLRRRRNASPNTRLWSFLHLAPRWCWRRLSTVPTSSLTPSQNPPQRRHLAVAPAPGGMDSHRMMALPRLGRADGGAGLSATNVGVLQTLSADAGAGAPVKVAPRRSATPGMVTTASSGNAGHRCARGQLQRYRTSAQVATVPLPLCLACGSLVAQWSDSHPCDCVTHPSPQRRACTSWSPLPRFRGRRLIDRRAGLGACPASRSRPAPGRAACLHHACSPVTCSPTGAAALRKCTTRPR